VDHELVAAVEDEDHGLEQSSVGVEAEAELSGGAVVVEVLDPQGPGSSLDGVVGSHSMLAGGGMDLHAAGTARASRITSDRDLLSRAARASRAASSAEVRRNVTTWEGSAPRPGRPRPRVFSFDTS